MIQIICLLFPALFSVFALERLLGKKLNKGNFAFVFVTNTLIINIVSFFLIYVLSGSATMTLSTNGAIRVSYALAYLVIACLTTLLTVFLERLYFYRFRINISEIPSDKTDEQNSDNGEK